MHKSSLYLPAALHAWGTDQFAAQLKTELEQLQHRDLPLQAGLTQTSYVSDTPFQVSVLSVNATEQDIVATIGVFYQGIIAGSCCSDDPTPVEEQNEYCEFTLSIDKTTAAATIAPVQE